MKKLLMAVMAFALIVPMAIVISACGGRDDADAIFTGITAQGDVTASAVTLRLEFNGDPTAELVAARVTAAATRGTGPAAPVASVTSVTSLTRVGNTNNFDLVLVTANLTNGNVITVTITNTDDLSVRSDATNGGTASKTDVSKDTTAVRTWTVVGRDDAAAVFTGITAQGAVTATGATLRLAFEGNPTDYLVAARVTVAITATEGRTIAVDTLERVDATNNFDLKLTGANWANGNTITVTITNTANLSVRSNLSAGGGTANATDITAGTTAIRTWTVAGIAV